MGAVQQYVVPVVVGIGVLLVIALLVREVIVERRRAKDRSLLRECSALSTSTDEVRYRRMARERKL
jgi:hypothetical protein